MCRSESRYSWWLKSFSKPASSILVATRSKCNFMRKNKNKPRQPESFALSNAQHTPLLSNISLLYECIQEIAISRTTGKSDKFCIAIIGKTLWSFTGSFIGIVSFLNKCNYWDCFKFQRLDFVIHKSHCWKWNEYALRDMAVFETHHVRIPIVSIMAKRRSNFVDLMLFILVCNCQLRKFIEK